MTVSKKTISTYYRWCMGLSFSLLYIIVMVIGFTEERQYVLENEIPGVYAFLVNIDLATLRVSERGQTMSYRLLTIGTATVAS